MDPKELGNNPDNRSQATPQTRRKWRKDLKPIEVGMP